MRRVPHLAALCCAASLAVPARAQPEPPEVTAGAGLKQLRFDWNYVPRASCYELWFRANPGAAWARMADAPSWRPNATFAISAHLLHGRDAR